MEMGPQSYLLEEDEYLWKKELPNIVEIMLRLVAAVFKCAETLKSFAYGINYFINYAAVQLRNTIGICMLIIISIAFHSDLLCLAFHRSGGCHGDSDIRKIAYFESSVEPEIAAGRVGLQL